MLDTDAVVIGAGPVGLFQVFELGLLGYRAQVVDALPVPGGQCIELYADKPIYDIPGTRVCTGRELIDRLLAQAEPFEPGFHLDQQVERIERQPDGSFLVRTTRQTDLRAKAVVIAGGAGSFQPRRLKIEGLAAHEGRQLFYRAPQDDASLHGRRLLVIGDDDIALAYAARMAPVADVTLMHRRDDFRATDDLVAQVRELRAGGVLEFIAAQPTGLVEENGTLLALKVLAADGQTRDLPLDALVVLTGLSPRLGPIADWGLALERKQVVVDTATFATSEPGIFAVGDINTYRGKRKLILCGFHEATLAAYGIAAHIAPDTPVHLEYTTTSPRLHRALGVAGT